VANNLMTIGALGALRARSLRVPDDVALVAVDNPPWSDLVDPALTTLAQPVRPMADCAFSLLLERIRRERAKPRTEVFSFELIVRQSCGAATS
jgi:DNA-binding LacI/PurR family transcriptional regulator